MLLRESSGMREASQRPQQDAAAGGATGDEGTRKGGVAELGGAWGGVVPGCQGYDHLCWGCCHGDAAPRRRAQLRMQRPWEGVGGREVAACPGGFRALVRPMRGCAWVSGSAVLSSCPRESQQEPLGSSRYL